MQDAQFLGIDLGRSAVKAVARYGSKTFTTIFPSAVVKAKPIVFQELMESAAADTVLFKGDDYWIGKTALVQGIGSEPVGRNDDWVTGPEHDILVLAAVQKLISEGLNFQAGKAHITLGVPSRVFKERRELVNTIRRNIIALLSNASGKPSVYIHAQPMGVIARHTLDVQGFTAEGRDLAHDSFAVIEVGQFTTDFSAVIKGQPMIDATDSTDGVELVTNHVRSRLRDEGIHLATLDMQSLLANPTMKVRGEVKNLEPSIREGIDQVLMPKIMAAARSIFNPMLLQTADAILLAGGGAPIILAGIKAMPQMSHAIQLENPREAVADGFARLSALMHATQATAQEVAHA